MLCTVIRYAIAVRIVETLARQLQELPEAEGRSMCIVQ